MVRPFLLSATTTSATVPVSDPSGSPLARASAEGVAIPVRSLAVKGTGAAAGAAAGVAPGAAAAGASGAGTGGAAGAWAHASDASKSVTLNNNVMRLVIFMILSSGLRSLSPGGFLLKRRVDKSDNPR